MGPESNLWMFISLLFLFKMSILVIYGTETNLAEQDQATPIGNTYCSEGAESTPPLSNHETSVKNRLHDRPA
jgi:hypothetical protein